MKHSLFQNFSPFDPFTPKDKYAMIRDVPG